ncbi:hypothetical protein TrVE_jg287 [Triparma verrucosa]|uniref:Pectin lyase-like protein n=1 Tax=Triparma verrucosa TaxID=1606542 RepID=A0A9W7CLZ6_9STRA|nr:hypothetical protein TrVE_jg287 [Triparma verrucosa]
MSPSTPTTLLLLLLFSLNPTLTCSLTTYNTFSDLGAIPNSKLISTAIENSRILENALNAMNKTSDGDSTVLEIEKGQTYYLQGGIYATGLRHSKILIDGTLKFREDGYWYGGGVEGWPMTTKKGKEHPKECLELRDVENVTFTSSSSGRGKTDRGVIDGSGQVWWGLPLFGYMSTGTARPHLIYVKRAKDFVFENIVLKDSPRWTFVGHGLDNAVIRDCSIVARRTRADGHGMIDLSAFNTDGFDVSGHDVHIHDCDIWNQDDCIAVKDDKDGSYNMLFENINASGTGLVIGSIGTTHVRNITFRDSYLHRSYKGIFLKFRDGANNQNNPGIIEDVLYKNITIFESVQWPIWIGPAQQAISSNPCNPSPCSLCWPSFPHFGGDTCDPIAALYKNITLDQVTLTNPVTSPGVILGSSTERMQDLTFNDVVVSDCGEGASFDRIESFPGLKQDLSDVFVFEFYLMLTASIFTFICISILICCDYSGNTQRLHPRKWCMGKRSWLIPPNQDVFWTNAKIFTVGIVLFTFIPVYIMGSSLPGYGGHLNTAEYYECTGVDNGVAKGKTNIIPSCFIDETEGELMDSECQSWVIPTIGTCYVAFLVLFYSFVFWVPITDWRNQRNEEYQERNGGANGMVRTESEEGMAVELVVNGEDQEERRGSGVWKEDRELRGKV